jgi:hypothetical protein
MSVKSTHLIKKEDAINLIENKMFSLTDQQLSDIVEIIINNDFFNYSVVDNHEFGENKFAEYPDFFIDDLLKHYEERL